MSNIDAAILTNTSSIDDYAEVGKDTTEKLRYRADIDGLRGISILFVFLYHLFPQIFVGGFIGVDIFFVISGFLISKIIFKKLQTSSFSFIQFYSRRIKRIFPALIITCAVCIGYGWLVLFPNEFTHLAKHVGSASIFLTNLTLYREAGYFDFASEAKPLLHLWSLAIEEQFYLLWPLLIWGIFKLNKKEFFNVSPHKKMVFFIALTTLCSFSIHLYLYHARPNLAFYFTGARIWEMSIGSLGAYYVLFLQKKQLSKFALDVMSLASIAIIIASLIFIKNTNGYFEVLIIFPVISCLFLLINSDRLYVNNKILSHPSIVFLGLISYPVYLLHWPCISFLKIISENSLNILQKGSIFFLVIIFGYAIYKYVEIPIRKRSSSAAVYVLLILMAFLGIAGYSGSQSIINPRVSFVLPHAKKVTKAFNDWDYPTSNMHLFSFNGEILYKIGSSNHTILFLGDSNAEQYAPRIDKLIASGKSKKSVVFATRGGICPIPNVGRSEEEINFIKNVVEYAHREEVKEIVITGQWIGYLSGKAKNYSYATSFLQGNLSESAVVSAAVNDLKQMIADLISIGKKVYIISSIPHGNNFGPKHFFTRDLLGNWEFSLKHVRKTDWVKGNAKANALLYDIAKTAGAVVINPENYLCNDNVCFTHHTDGMPLYKDEGHLRAEYVRNHLTWLDFLFTGRQ